jgi:hypothetical protein
MAVLPRVIMPSMPAQIYNLAFTASSAIWINPLILVGLIALVLAVVTGLAGRLAILCEDLRYKRFLGRNR